MLFFKAKGSKAACWARNLPRPEIPPGLGHCQNNYNSLPPELQPRVAPQFSTKENEESWFDAEKRLLGKWRAREHA